ncbi:hypothetical protein SNOG_09489 [Parastagonospora nodorum SN15]|uniref:Uncharacterized protein n=1 Tax=Phaeosphaeria nodorum (strain SN15 / ATCC MYA-4574 / FGSC 10173) TaxID=321614 RepID=Q0UFH5_PHANO|nr:hypothetical protein SNOG_09489 [Parastagonospora nodorum SN15]EAT82754.1 hypothetical protein SNOG_09489 [Parastagonospora nodorum SN15]
MAYTLVITADAADQCHNPISYAQSRARCRFAADQIFNKVSLMKSEEETELPDSQANSTSKDLNNGASTPLRTDHFKVYKQIIAIPMNIRYDKRRQGLKLRTQ